MKPDFHHSGALVLVTGGAGFIGSHTVDRLLSEGCRVIVLDDFSSGSRNNLRHCSDDPRVTTVQADIAEGIEVPLHSVVSRQGPIERIVHLAAQTAVPRSIEEPVEDIRANAAGTAQVLEYARCHGVTKVVFASSSAVYDDDAAVPVTETSRPRPSSPYGINKFAGELLLDYYNRAHGLSGTALRFFNVYGPRQDPRSHYSGVISVFISCALRNLPITIFGNGKQTRDFIFVEDVARALTHACLRPVGDGAVINLGTGLETAVEDLAERIVTLSSSQSRINHAPSRIGEIQRSAAQTALASELLGFRPAVMLPDGLERTLRWFAFHQDRRLKEESAQNSVRHAEIEQWGATT